MRTDLFTAFDLAQQKIITNAQTYANAVWDCLPHTTKSEAAIKFAMALTALEKDGIFREPAFPYEEFSIADYLPSSIFPYATLDDMFGSVFADMAYDTIFNLMETYSDNVVAFPNPDEIIS